MIGRSELRGRFQSLESVETPLLHFDDLIDAPDEIFSAIKLGVQKRSDDFRAGQ